MSENANLIYSLIFDIPKEGQIEVNKFVEGMKDCLSALEEINHAIVGSIDSTIQVISYIEALEAGSIKYDLKDDIKNKKADDVIELVGATTIGIATGDWSGLILITLKEAKNKLFEINNQRLENKEKERQICEAMRMELNKSNLNNELKGYLLDEKKLLNAVKHFAKGVKKTGNNVFWQKSQNDKKIQLDSTLANEDSDDLQEDHQEEMVKQNENIVTDIYILLTPTSKEDCLWELYDGSAKVKAKMEDKKFFNDYINNDIKLGGDEKLKIRMKIETYTERKKIKKEYTILEVEILEIGKQSKLL
jgi:hypothetical protein